jgi:hypothetical protein
MLRRSQFCLVLAGLVGVLPGALRAQGRDTQIGFELGYSHARFSPVGVSSATQEGSIIAGFLSRRIAGPLSGQIELMLSRRGGGLSAPDASGTFLGTAQLVYIEVPVLARITVPVGRLRPVLLGGGSFAVSVGCELQVAGADNVEQERCDGDSATVALAGSDFNAVFGGGLEYTTRSATLRLELRRIVGLRNLAPGQDLKNRVWAVLAGITF